MVGRTLGDIAKAQKKNFEMKRMSKSTSWMLKISMF
jgi:hypothetical protein